MFVLLLQFFLVRYFAGKDVELGNREVGKLWSMELETVNGER